MPSYLLKLNSTADVLMEIFKPAASEKIFDGLLLLFYLLSFSKSTLNYTLMLNYQLLNFVVTFVKSYLLRMKFQGMWINLHIRKVLKIGLTLSSRKFLLSKKQSSDDFQSKSIDWFLYDSGFHHENDKPVWNFEEKINVFLTRK